MKKTIAITASTLAATALIGGLTACNDSSEPQESETVHVTPELTDPDGGGYIIPDGETAPQNERQGTLPENYPPTTIHITPKLTDPEGGGYIIPDTPTP